jgi:hypothetical protein
MSRSPLIARTLRSAAMAVTATSLSLSLATAWAEGPPIKPGLWEITTDSQTVNGKALPDMSSKMAEQMQKLPPEMRAKMEAQMKARGVQMAPAGGQMGVRMCITKDMLDKNQWQKTDGHCENTGLSHSGAKWAWKFKCTQPPSEGEGSTTFQGPDAYVSDIHISSQRNGQPVTMDMKHHAKWLGADCGDLKPLSSAAPKP